VVSGRWSWYLLMKKEYGSTAAFAWKRRLDDHRCRLWLVYIEKYLKDCEFLTGLLANAIINLYKAWITARVNDNKMVNLIGEGT
jgi:hypothetical protein